MESDTTAEAARLRVQVLRELDGAERLRQALDLSEAVRKLAELGQQDRNRGKPRVSSTDAA